MSRDNQLAAHAKDVDEQAEFGFLSRLPASLRHYLTEECPVDFSAADVFFELDDRGPSFLINRLRWEAIALLNEDTDIQRRRYPGLRWPEATLRNTTPIRRTIRKTSFRK